MTAPPVPTTAPQDAWYTLTTGNINPSAADTVPNITFLGPTGEQPGLVGSLDGEIIYLAGTVAKLDGGQQFLMWEATSLAVQDLKTVFNPWPVDTPGVPGRWVSVSVGQTFAGGQIITSGSVIAILPSSAPVVNVLVNKTIGSLTTLLLPINPGVWQVFRIKDRKGDAATNPITISGNGSTIEGATTYVIANDGGSTDLTWDGMEFMLS
jgi:hypothetical protein